MSDLDRPIRNEIIVHPNRSERSSTVLYLEPLDSGPAGPDASARSAEMWRMIRANARLIIGALMLGAVGGFALSLVMTPIYSAKVSLEIQNPVEAANFQVGDSEAIAPESYLATQATILQSRTLHNRALERVKKENLGIANQAGGHFSLRRFLHIAPSYPFALSAEPSANLPAAFAQGVAGAGKLPPITVSVAPSNSTRIVTVTCESPNPKMAAAFANALVNEYMDSNVQARWDAINSSRQWLTRQLEESRSKLEQAENQLQAYGRSSNLLFTGGDKESADQEKLNQLQEALSKAQQDRIEKQSAYEIAASTPADAVPQVLDNARLSDYQRQIADLQRQLAELSSQYTPQYPKVQQLQAQIDQLQSTFKKERQDVLTRIRSEYQAALMQERLLSAAYRSQVEVVSQQTEKGINYNILQRDVDTDRQMYDSLLQKSREADVATAMRGSNTRIIDPAETPSSPSTPNFLFNTLLGSSAGLLLALAFVITRESLDRSYKSPGDLSVHLNLPELGAIPVSPIPLSNSAAKASRFSFPMSADSADANGQMESTELASWHDRSSVVAESFRSAVTSILHSVNNGASPRVILVSSAIRAEGKTTIVSNLGIALSEIGQRVLLIDGDMRKPRLNEVFNLPNDWGLSDLLREKSSLRDCPLEALVKTTQLPELRILTSGPATTSISNLLYSHRMLELLQRLRSEFDIILIDTPPMLDISDARILGRLADAAILVFRAGKTSRDAAMAAKRRLTDDGIPVLGTILNAWDVKNNTGYGYDVYNYYSPTS